MLHHPRTRWLHPDWTIQLGSQGELALKTWKRYVQGERPVFPTFAARLDYESRLQHAEQLIAYRHIFISRHIFG